MQEKSLVCEIKGKNVQKNKGKEGEYVWRNKRKETNVCLIPFISRTFPLITNKG